MSSFWDAINAGHARRGSGKQAEARVEFERALSLAADDDERAEALLQVGWSLCGEGNHLQAVPHFEKVPALYACDSYKKSQGQVAAGNCLRHAQTHAEAKAAYEKVLTLPGASPWHKSEALLGIGNVLAGEGRHKYKEARAAFERVQKSDGAHLHHVSEALPILGISGLATVLVDYQEKLLWMGILSNAVGIGWMLWVLSGSKLPLLMFRSKVRNHKAAL